MVNKEEIEKLSNNNKHSWYMHFWRNRKVIVIFSGEKFEFDYDDKSSWKPAVEYGLHVDIPLSQLDFPID